MGNKVLCIEIGQQMTRICEVDYNKKTPHVYNCIFFETPVGVIEDGFIRDKLALATVLREQITLAGIKNDKVIFTLSSTKIASREAIIPLVKNNQLASIIQTNAKDYFPVNIDEYDITYSVLETISTKEAKQMRILVLAAPALLIKAYFELAEMLNYHIVSIDYTGNSSYQLLRGQVGTGINLVVQINDANTIINLLENANLLLQRSMPYGTSSIASSVISNSVFRVSTYSEAMRLLSKEKLINQHFDSIDEVAFTLEDISEEYSKLTMKENAKSDVTSSLGNLLSNVSRVIDYFATKHPGKKIDKFYLTGEGSKIQGLDKLIMNEMGVEIQALRQFSNVTFAKTSMEIESNQSAFLSCIGAAIAPIDFTPAEYIVKPVSNHSMVFPILLLIIATLGSAAIFISSYMIYQRAEQDHKDMQTKIESIKDIKKVYSDYQESENNLKNIEAFDAMTKNASDNLLSFIAELEQKTPKGTVVETLSLQENAASIKATSTSKEVLAKYIETLQSFASIQSVTASNYVETKDENNMPTVSYTIVCVFR